METEWGIYTHKLGIDEDVEAFGFFLGARDPTVTRSVFDFVVSLGF